MVQDIFIMVLGSVTEKKIKIFANIVVKLYIILASFAIIDRIVINLMVFYIFYIVVNSTKDNKVDNEEVIKKIPIKNS